MFRTALHILTAGLFCFSMRAQESQVDSPLTVIVLSVSFVALGGYLMLTGPLGELKPRRAGAHA